MDGVPLAVPDIYAVAIIMSAILFAECLLHRGNYFVSVNALVASGCI